MRSGRMGPNAQGISYQPPAQQEHGGPSDSLEVYFECITTCSLDDGACVTACVEQLREQH